jgi:hypothetical protein
MLIIKTKSPLDRPKVIGKRGFSCLSYRQVKLALCFVKRNAEKIGKKGMEILK